MGSDLVRAALIRGRKVWNGSLDIVGHNKKHQNRMGTRGKRIATCSWVKIDEKAKKNEATRARKILVRRRGSR